MQKTWKIIETLAHLYISESTQQELSNEYQHDRVYLIFWQLFKTLSIATCLKYLHPVN